MESLDLLSLQELQDPYSDVSLFLSRKVKQQFQSSCRPKEWSLDFQEKLLESIAPEFQKKFPRHRLGIALLKKTWEKISSFSELLEKEQEAFTIEGKLNLHFLIRENLKMVLAQRKNSSLHPFLLAQQLALKVGESVATFEGARPALHHLTELIWSAEKHLLPLATLAKTELDVKDRLLLKWMLDCLMQHPDLTHHQLHQDLQNKVQQFQTLKEEPMRWSSALSMHWASLLLPHCCFMQTSPAGDIDHLRSWIHRFLANATDQTSHELIQDIKTAHLRDSPLISLNELEILSWCCLKERLPPLEDLQFMGQLLKEAELHLIDHPKEHWQAAIAQAVHFFIQAHDISLMATQADWNRRIAFWSVQGELVLRALHFPQTPLLQLVLEMVSQNRPLNDPSIVPDLREQFLSHYASPLIDPSVVHQKADLLRKYGWYHLLSIPQDSTLDRWILLQEKSVAGLTLETRLKHLISRAQKQLPLLPIDRHTLRSCPNAFCGEEKSPLRQSEE